MLSILRNLSRFTNCCPQAILTKETSQRFERPGTPMDALTVIGIFMLGAAAGAILTHITNGPTRERTSNATTRWADDLLTGLGAPLNHPEQQRRLSSAERVEWLQARDG